MSIFAPKQKNDSKPTYTGLQVQTSSSSMPVTILWGTNSIAPNLVWYDNFKTITKKEKQGGKGGGSVTTTSYSYTSDVILGLCEGPIIGVGRIWADKSEKSLSEEGVTIFNGNSPQDPWPYLVTSSPTKALSYNGLAYAADNDYQLTDGATIRNHNFEIKGQLTGSMSAAGNNDDADIALVIDSFLTDPRFGCYFPSAYIAEDTLIGGTNTYAFQCYCKAVGFAMSPAISSQEKASRILGRWLDLTNSTVIWSDGKLKFLPYAEENITGNGFTWVSRTAPVYDLTDLDFVATNDDPVKVSRIDVAQTDNIIRLEISDRTNRYSKLPVEIRDESAIYQFGPKVGSTIKANEYCLIDLAAVSGQMILQRKLYIRNNYKFTLSWEYCLLEPMDVVTITDSNLGVVQRSVRIVEIEEDEDGNLAIIAEDLVLGLGAPTLYPKQGVENNPINQATPAVSVNPPMIFEPTPEMSNNVAQIWVAASGVSGDQNWGGAQVWVSTDNASYTQLGTINSRATQGVLTAALADYTGADPDTVNVLSVDLSQSAGSLISTSAVDAQAGFTSAVIDNEVLSYTTATLTAPNSYNLDDLYRGQSGTTHASHASGAKYCRLDDSVEKIDLPDAYVGQTLYIKFVSFNIWGQGIQDISSLTPYTFTPSGKVAASDLLNRLRAGQPTDLTTYSNVAVDLTNLSEAAIDLT